MCVLFPHAAWSDIVVLFTMMFIAYCIHFCLWSAHLPAPPRIIFRTMFMLTVLCLLFLAMDCPLFVVSAPLRTMSHQLPHHVLGTLCGFSFCGFDLPHLCVWFAHLCAPCSHHLPHHALGAIRFPLGIADCFHAANQPP